MALATSAVGCDAAESPVAVDTSVSADLENDTHESDAQESDTHESDAHESDTHESDTHEGDAHEGDTHEGDVHHAPHWSYGDTESGPEFWGELSEDWLVCGEGQRQSPVDIPAVPATTDPTLTVDYLPSPLRVLNNGHTIKALFDAAPFSTLTIAETAHTLLEVHYHAESEHTVDGLRFDLELHLVHQDAAGNRAVIGLLFVVGDPHPSLSELADHLDAATATATEIPEALIQPAALLPVDRSAWHYPGSLTTPPCDENVAWFVMSSVQELSAEQLDAFTRHYSGNFRPAQPLNERQFAVPTER